MLDWIAIAKDSRGYEIAGQERPDVFRSFLESPEYAAIDRLWLNHCDGQAADDADCRVVADLPSDVLRLYLLASGAIGEVASSTMLQKHPRFAGLTDWPAFRHNLDRFLTLPPGPWADRLSRANFASEEAKVALLALERACSFQVATIGDRELRIFDPLDGSVRSTRDSYHIFGRGVYLYAGARPFYLITGGAGHKAVGIFLPTERLTIDLRAGLSQVLLPATMASTFAAQIRRLATNNADFATAVALDEQAIVKKSVVVLAGQIENFAHHAWNHYPGLERIIYSGLAERIDRVESFGTEFYGPLPGIFPEIADRHLHRARTSLVGAAPFDPASLTFQAGGYFITRELKQRLSTAAHRTATPPPESDAPMIWFGLRTGSRAWVDQEAGIVAIITAILAEEPDATFVLDGFSYPVGEDHISAKWKDAIAQVGAMADGIVASAPGGAKIVNLVGRGLDENLLYAERVAAYVAPVGTTQHKVGWFAQGGGVIYSGPDILKTMPNRRPGCWEAEDIVVAQYQIGEVAAPGEKRSEGDRRHNLQNLHLDVDALTQGLLRAIRAWRAVRQAAPTA